ncbi:MAG: DUF4321 domain-containing protein [Epulopiscium sp.]|nr:DUF4321 domain-containing protein [Candidatus Epulonipiscium sp.]
MKGCSAQTIWVLLLLWLIGIVLGGFIGDYLGGITSLKWLAYGKSFGLTSPLVLDMGVVVIQFGLTIRFTIAGIIGMIIATFIYKKM